MEVKVPWNKDVAMTLDVVITLRFLHVIQIFIDSEKIEEEEKKLFLYIPIAFN